MVILKLVLGVPGWVLAGYSAAWVGSRLGISAPWWAWSLIMGGVATIILIELLNMGGGVASKAIEEKLESLRLEVAALRSRVVADEDEEDSIP